MKAGSGKAEQKKKAPARRSAETSTRSKSAIQKTIGIVCRNVNTGIASGKITVIPFETEQQQNLEIEVEAEKIAKKTVESMKPRNPGQAIQQGPTISAAACRHVLAKVKVEAARGAWDESGRRVTRSSSAKEEEDKLLDCEAESILKDHVPPSPTTDDPEDLLKSNGEDGEGKRMEQKKKGKEQRTTRRSRLQLKCRADWTGKGGRASRPKQERVCREVGLGCVPLITPQCAVC